VKDYSWEGFMKDTNKPILAICYDFDKTLSPNDMQAQGYIQSLKEDTDAFWKESNTLASDNDMDQNLAYMYLMVEKSKGKFYVTKNKLMEYGRQVKLFNGVEGWFKRINEYGNEKGVQVEHYIISSGLKEMIEGTVIASEFKKIYASCYYYGESGEALWPAQAINYTNKTQFLFRIEKGILNINDQKVNDYIAHSELRVPFRNIVYIGDSATDIPCMKLVNTYGGHSIGVFNPETQDKSKVYTMMAQNRIKYFAEAIYSKDSNLEKLLKMIIDKTVVTEVLEKRHFECNAEAESYPTNCRKDVLINDLEDSMNFLNIRNTINELRKMGVFTVAQNLKILNAAIQNPQIRSIIEEKEVKEFYSKILKNTDPESDVSKMVKELFA
jgi:hypothetical protein